MSKLGYNGTKLCEYNGFEVWLSGPNIGCTFLYPKGSTRDTDYIAKKHSVNKIKTEADCIKWVNTMFKRDSKRIYSIDCQLYDLQEERKKLLERWVVLRPKGM